MREGVLCAADLPVCLPLGGTVCGVAMVLPAREWADRLGIAWDTVRQRRYRGDTAGVDAQCDNFGCQGDGIEGAE